MKRGKTLQKEREYILHIHKEHRARVRKRERKLDKAKKRAIEKIYQTKRKDNLTKTETEISDSL